ncbi:hypothetical protein Tco_0189503 [Tanacetum coccineum]
MDPLYDQISTYPCNVRTFSDPILYLAGLKTSWKYSPKKPVIYHRGQEMDFRIFMVQGVDGEFNFLPEGGLDENRSSTKSVNNEAPGGLSPIGHDAPSYLEVGKRSKVAGKRKVAGKASTPLDVDSDPIYMVNTILLFYAFPSAKELKDATDCHWVIAHVTPPSWKQYLREIKLISALHKARTSSDTIREREIQKYKAYAELEKKCNEALLDLDKNPLVSDMRSEIEALQSQTLSILRDRVEGLESEGKSLRASDIQLLQEVDSLRQDRATVVARVIPDATMKLIHSDEMGVLIARLVKASIIHGRCASFEEVAKLKNPSILEEMPGHRPSSKEEYDQAGNDLPDASYPLLAELTADPHASVEQLLSKKPQSLQSKHLFLKAS